ncbi:cell envelope biogenesis protein TonB [Bacteroidia bacterium]|nr:cell envelope biogenesis protein TonB [Bacteroidia bacterium]
MAQDIDLTSPKWTALVFEGKNKKYGAYELRNDSSNRHLKALAIVTIVGLAVIYLPNLIKSFIPKPQEVLQTTEVELADLNNVNEVNKENQIEEIKPVAPPPMLKATVQFTPPVVVKDEEVVEQKMLTQDELKETDKQISVATVEGTKDGVDIRDLAEHKVITEAPQEQIFQHVEQMPQFPGGDAELMKWLGSNIQYPTIASEQGIQGRVTLRFVVRPDGSIDDVQVVKSLEPSCDKEAVRAVKKMPKWIPGKQNGNPVSVYYNLPVVFRLQNS